jgi:hypothetical protein
MSTTNATNANKSTNPLSKYSAFAIYVPIAGIVAVAVSMAFQFGVIDQGSSGQLTIDSNLAGIGWAIGTGLIITFVGLLLYRTIYSSERAFLWLFGFAWLGYLLGNIAIMLSLYQVQLTQT